MVTNVKFVDTRVEFTFDGHQISLDYDGLKFIKRGVDFVFLGSAFEDDPRYQLHVDQSNDPMLDRPTTLPGFTSDPDVVELAKQLVHRMGRFGITPA